jgi:hypothetical protein
MIHFNQLLELTTSRTLAPSTMGAQLTAISTGFTPPSADSSDTVQLIHHTLSNAEVMRCMDSLLLNGPTIDGKWGKVYPALSRLRSLSSLDGQYLSMGYVVVQVLRLYQEYGVREPVRGLVRVYRWMSTLSQKAYPMVDGAEDEAIASFMGQDTREVKLARSLAAEVYADAYLAASNFVSQWNQDAERKVRQAS